MHPSCFVLSGGSVLVRETNDFQLISVACKAHVNKASVRLYKPALDLLHNKLGALRKQLCLASYIRVHAVLGKTRTANRPEDDIYYPIEEIAQDYRRSGGCFSNYRELNNYQRQVLLTENLAREILRPRGVGRKKYVVIDVGEVFRPYSGTAPQMSTLTVCHAGDLAVLLQAHCFDGFSVPDDQDIEVVSGQQFTQAQFDGVRLFFVLYAEGLDRLPDFVGLQVHCEPLQQRLRAYMVRGGRVAPLPDGYFIFYVANIQIGLATTVNSYL